MTGDAKKTTGEIRADALIAIPPQVQRSPDPHASVIQVESAYLDNLELNYPGAKDRVQRAMQLEIHAQKLQEFRRTCVVSARWIGFTGVVSLEILTGHYLSEHGVHITTEISIIIGFQLIVAAATGIAVVRRKNDE
jgi:hypothetical protein